MLRAFSDSDEEPAILDDPLDGYGVRDKTGKRRLTSLAGVRRDFKYGKPAGMTVASTKGTISLASYVATEERRVARAAVKQEQEQAPPERFSKRIAARLGGEENVLPDEAGTSSDAAGHGGAASSPAAGADRPAAKAYRNGAYAAYLAAFSDSLPQGATVRWHDKRAWAKPGYDAFKERWGKEPLEGEAAEAAAAAAGAAEGSKKANDACAECREFQQSSKEQWVACDSCGCWYHAACAGLSQQEFKALREDMPWSCCKCEARSC